MRNLVADVGNSKVKLAVFDDDQLIYRDAGKTLQAEMVKELAGKFSLQHMLVSAVKKVDENWLAEIRKILNVLELNASLPLPIKLSYETPKTLGSDRIAGAVAGHQQSKPNPVLVIDSGTCITYDVVDATGTFIGGQISPGLKMRLRAMHQFTNRLPKVAIEGHIPEIGASTSGSLQSGAFYGLLHEMNGFIEYYNGQFSNLRVIITGGNSSLFVPKMKYEIFAVPNLIITGLNQILRHNVEG